MLKVTKTKALVINMGNYESYRTEVSVDIPVENPGSTAEYFMALNRADDIINESLTDEITEAAGISDVRNTYVLTWLKNRKEEANAKRTDES